MPGNKILDVTTTAPDRQKIDEFLPTPDFSACYAMRINAPPSVVYQCVLRSDFNKQWVVRLLMTIRTGKRPPRNRVPGDLPQRLQGTGFVVLAEVPSEELVIGVAGKFWRPNGTSFDLRDRGRAGQSFARNGARLDNEETNRTHSLVAFDVRIIAIRSVLPFSGCQPRSHPFAALWWMVPPLS